MHAGFVAAARFWELQQHSTKTALYVESDFLLKLIKIQQGAFSTRAKLCVCVFFPFPLPCCWAFSEICCDSDDTVWMTFSIITQHLVMKEHMKDRIHEAQPKWHINELTKSWPWELSLLQKKKFNVCIMVLRDNGWLIKKHFPCFITIENKGILIIAFQCLWVAAGMYNNGSLQSSRSCHSLWFLIVIACKVSSAIWAHFSLQTCNSFLCWSLIFSGIIHSSSLTVGLGFSRFI